MAALPLEQALENIYVSMQNDNDNIDHHIGQLKATLAESGTNTVTVDPARLVQPNRQGRKLMQAYFRQRGVIVEFS